jgi:hypothetical protein
VSALGHKQTPKADIPGGNQHVRFVLEALARDGRLFGRFMEWITRAERNGGSQPLGSMIAGYN